MKDIENFRYVTVLSFEGSGSNWLCYIIENTTGLLVDNFSTDIVRKRKYTNEEILKRSVLIKEHGRSKDLKQVFDSNKDSLILVLRNYKECIPRWVEAKDSELNVDNVLRRLTEKGGYLDIVNLFDRSKGKKLLIYYEDLLLHPEREISKVISFLKECVNICEDSLKEFMINYKMHKEKSLQNYNPKRSKTKGDKNKLLFHSRKLSVEDRKKVDSYIKNNFSKLRSSYLKKYEEEWKSSAVEPGTKNHLITSVNDFIKYQKNTVLENWLEKKRIAYVGPSPYLEGKGKGNLIDSYDLVVRVGQLSPLSKDAYKDYGRRTDILVYSFNEKQIEEVLKNIDYLKSLKCAICAMVSASFKKEHEDFFEKVRKLGVCIHKPDDRYLYGKFKEVGTICNSGLMGIIMLLNYNIEELYVTGLSFYNMGEYGKIYSKDYYNMVVHSGIIKEKKENMLVSGEQMRSDLHNQEKQIDYFRDLAKRYSNTIELDGYLLENLCR